MGDWIDLPTLDGADQFAAYLAEPSDQPTAAIIVIQEIFGVNPGIRRKADDWAALGYLAIAPDLFWRFAPRYDKDPDVPADMEDAFQIRTRFDADLGIEDVEATIRHVRQHLPAGSKVGVVGYCMGGRVAYLAATRTDADASVGYYGAGIDASLDEARAIARPLMLHFAEADHFITPDIRAKIHGALDPHPQVTIHDYANVDHGFAATSGSRRNEAAADLADGRTRAFFAEHLR